MFNKILIANRGEIACRIIETAHRLGIETVAVYSDADTQARHVRMADFSEHIGASPSNQSYLDVDAIIAAAKKHSAQAIHPGYGFLSENPLFSKACHDNNIVFIGPSADSMVTMADKSLAKAMMEKADVPVVPGFYSDAKNVDWKSEAAKIGVPLLIKAVAGGGGRGMRLVEDLTEFDAAFDAAQREAKAYFDDERVFLEKYLVQPRHIEIQVFADNHGECVYLFERDCSIQRRHQKIIEEAPAPNFSEELRFQMGTTGVRAAQSINYSGAGTIEFLLDRDGKFYFMEMNTRLQVEHPVTECITGLDLVEWQLLVAAGEKLPLKQDQISIVGHAIETRVYAEDPNQQFMPCVGEIAHLQFPDIEGLRVDTGYESGDHISMHYDPMIAKVIVYAQDRDHAIDALYKTLTQTQIVGVTTNVPMLASIINHRAFSDAKLSTHFLNDHPELLTQSDIEPTTNDILIAAFAVRQWQFEQTQEGLYASQDDFSPWGQSSNWRMNLAPKMAIKVSWQDNNYNISACDDVFLLENKEHCVTGDIFAHDATLTINQQSISASVIFWQQQCHVFNAGTHHIFQFAHSSEKEARMATTTGHITAPMPGTVVEVFVKNGAAVAAGDRLLIIEAMKMEHTMTANNDGTVEQLTVKAGDGVNEGMELLFIS